MTILYFRSTVDANPYSPTAGKKSTALPIGTENSTFSDYLMDDTAKDASTWSARVTTSLAQTTQQSGCIARFTSRRLTAQRLYSGVTYDFSTCLADEGNNNANAFLSASLYLWRPSISSVIGYIYDSSATLGLEWLSGSPTTLTGAVLTSTDDLDAQDGDVLVLEMWYNAIQSASKSYNNGFTFAVAGSGGYSIDSNLNISQDLGFFNRKRTIVTT